MRILLIEDDQDVARHVSRGLKESGHVVDIAENGIDGFSLANEENYDVLVIDRMLPRLDGLTLIENLRSRNNLTPVLILSALGELEDRIIGLRAGGDDYLPKPFAFEELLARVEALGGLFRDQQIRILRFQNLKWMSSVEKFIEQDKRLVFSHANFGFLNI